MKTKNRQQQEPTWDALVDDVGEGLRELFGHRNFRPGQADAVESVDDGEDALVVMPTGSGKSLCFQLPAFTREGVTLTISPLIALMKDQVDALTARGLPATFINSTLTATEQQRRLTALKRGAYKLVYVAPERLRSEDFLRTIDHVPVTLLAIDEAHCISQWGHDFRPDYLRMSELRERVGEPQTVALTATATRFVQRDILEQLGLPEANVLVSGFERPNLFFDVEWCYSDEEKLRRTEKLVRRHGGESIVIYGVTRRAVEEVATGLQERGIDAGFYHAGLSDAARAEMQEAWMRAEVPVLVATSAFGMGVDKPDVRAIIHHKIPGSIEAYYQQAGRAGRDGEAAECVVLFNHRDRGIHDFFIENSFPYRHLFERVWKWFRERDAESIEFDVDEVAKELSARHDRLHPMAFDSILRALKRTGHLEKLSYPGAGKRVVTIRELVPIEGLEIDWVELERRRGIALRQLDDILDYATEAGCFQAQLVRYFNSEPRFGDRCENCRNCRDTRAEAGGRERDVAHTEIIRKLLAGVARSQEGFGAHLVAAMLRGSRAKKVREHDLDMLSTFGVLEGFTQRELVDLLGLLIDFELLERGEHHVVQLTAKGIDVMAGRQAPEQELSAAVVNRLVDPHERLRVVK